jgi:hypothetical protein
MKKKTSFIIGVLLIIISISATSPVQAQAWERFNLNQSNITSIVLTDNSFFAFASSEYFVTGLPLMVDSEWSSMILPEIGIVKNAAIITTPIFQIFVLMNDNLWKMENSEWILVYLGVDNISVSIDNDQLFAWNGRLLYSYANNEWQTVSPGSNIKAVACSAHGDIMIATVDNIYSGKSVENLTLWSFSNQFTISDIVVNNSYYAALGQISLDAAWYSAPVETYYAYDHRLTTGQLVSGAVAQDTIWVIGVLGDSDCIFNTTGLSSLQIIDQSIIQIKSNGIMLAALDTEGYVYLHNNGRGVTSVAGIGIKPALAVKDSIRIYPNPIISSISSQVTFFSDIDTEAVVYNQLGEILKKISVMAGMNTIWVNLSPGLYFIRAKNSVSQKFAVQ